MQRSGKDFTLVKLLPPGVYQVGRQCRCAAQGAACMATSPGAHRFARRLAAAALVAKAAAAAAAAPACCCWAGAAVLTLCHLFPLSAPQYKFIVDSQWRHDPNLPSMYDDMGNINNVLEVQVGAACTAHCGAEAPLFKQAGLAQRCTSLLRLLQCRQTIHPACSLPSLLPPALQEYVPENLESLAGFDPPPSPPSRSDGCLPGCCSAGGRLRRP